MKVDRWVVLKGHPVFSCRTRKQAREYAKKNPLTGHCQYNYVGKVFDKQHKIVLDL